MNTFDAISQPLPVRLAQALARLSLVMRQDAWERGQHSELTPTQAQVLGLLAPRSDNGLSPGTIAGLLALTPPTVSDAVAALERKGAVERIADAADARRRLVRLTVRGRELAQQAEMPALSIVDAVAHLDPATQSVVFAALIQVIQQLQKAGRIRVDRMCVTCTHFRPNVHRDDPGTPHHCALVDAPFGDRHLRIDCPEHQPAEPVPV
ncbi:MarR family winged helix-turn-helix transcriptional regulator [Tahibacter amnicola]|uniref:MarR family transcriptional regulator n=1 Tax=Tahibacter amnicola TaxID=2976241 RepID=A0ABY6B8Y3_9GAMM|nr:MarR family winged helix-turn-helix transcriptional regulator [Tahibacter amnicola]UXI66329.1 MarR family transcriptional regulator [Tahibacter amnicola]